MIRFAFLLLVTALSGLADELPLTLQSRTPAGGIQTVREQWLPQQTAIIVCDMWDLHHCKNAVTREGEMAIRISLRPDGLVLEQLAPESCHRGRCRTGETLLAPAKDRAWYRVRFTVEASAQHAPPYGRITTKVDGEQALVTPLAVPIYDGSVSLKAGITQGDARRALAHLDDVSLIVR